MSPNNEIDTHQDKGHSNENRHPGYKGNQEFPSYRQDRPHALTRQKGCKIIGMRDGVMALGCNVTFGVSGSPVFMSSGGEMRLVAVVSAMGSDARNPVAYAVLVDAAIPAVLAVPE